MTGLAPDSYDVFINFRGGDTRHGFTGYLYNALKNAGVRTFFDAEKLKGGDEITPTLLKAIENSRLAITVFSKNYASSTFCLNELVHIHECIKRKGRLVLPIFYDVEPSEVRHQMGNYKKELSMHMKKHRADEDKIKRWKLALHEVANISGYHFNPRQEYEYQFIERIVKEISSKIKRVPLHVSEYPVGLEPRLKEITSLLQIGSNDKVIMVGICGMGGLGKTTTTCALYNSIADNFEGLCFLHDVKGKSKKHGLERIQETILSNIVGVAVDMKIQDVNEGVQVIKERFSGKKILLILDDIDEHKQLKKLAGNCDWFSAGSRIIITTRDEQLLVAHGVESIYNMEVFNDEESLELLSWNAFRNRQVDPCYKDVLKRAITYAQGLPLALEVIGSNLCRKTINEWESALDTYKLSLHKDIEQVLRVSYEDLEEVEKEIFLDIACAFNREELKHVKCMVEAVHDSNDLSYSIGVLVDKRLIRKYYNYIEMHDLIRDMGRKIVREESPNNPGKRSRLWFPQDIGDVLERNMGTNKVRMIVLNNWRECIEVNWDGEAFKSMKELKILIFENVKFSEDPKYLPESLKVMKWRSYPSSCLPPNFRPKKLVVLDLGHSCLSSLETITKTSDNLGILNLGGCNYVKEIPDLSNLKSLKELSLRECRNLIGIHDSIGYLPKLEILNVADCGRLKNFPRVFKLPSLSNLSLIGCSSLKYFPDILGKLKIRDLVLTGTGIKELPLSIRNLSDLRGFFFGGVFDSDFEIPNSIFLLPNLERISALGNGKRTISFNSKEAQEEAIWSQQCPNKVLISLRRCNISNDFLRNNLSRYVNVKCLNLSFSDFTILPSWIKECRFLKRLHLNGCKYLREVEGIPPNIIDLDATNCESLSLESQSILLSEELHGAPGMYNLDSEEEDNRYCCVSSRSIPKWVDHRSKGASISFWFRHSFPPALCFCVLIKPLPDIRSTSNTIWKAKLYINKKPSSFNELIYYNWPLMLDDDHLKVYYVEERYIEEFERKRRLPEVRWYHAEFCVECKASAPIEIGMYASKQLCDMENITFTNPYLQISDFTWGDQVEQLGTRMEEKVAPVNKKRRLTGNDNFSSSSNAFICPINQDDNDATPQVPFVKACEIINNSKETSLGDLDLNTTSLPMLPRTEQACDTFTNQGHNTEDEKGALLASLLENIHL